MTLDGLTLYYTLKEIEQQITGCKIEKIYHPKKDTVIISFYPKNLRLLICAGADSRMHLTTKKYENPKSPSAFCMFLRKYITGAKLIAVEQTSLERVVTLTLETRDELGMTRNIMLISELMGKYSNIMLVKNNLIMDSLRRITSSQSRIRSVLPGLAYKMPQSSKLNPLRLSRVTLIEMLRKREGANIKTYLSSFLQGLSGQTADEILFRYMPKGYFEQPRESEKLSDIIINFFSQPPEPTMYLHGGTPFSYSAFNFHSMSDAQIVRCDSFNSMIDDYYAAVNATIVFSAKHDKLMNLVSKQLQKQIATLQKQQTTIQQAKKADVYKMRGDIITANIYRIAKGQGVLSATDYVSGEEVVIKLDARLSPAANAQRQYKRYSKLKAGLNFSLRRMKETQNNIDFLESVRHSLSSCETADELNEIEYELHKTGFMPRKQPGVRTVATPSKPHKFISSDGYVIFAGKNNRQNDLLTIKTAEPDDIWLHTKDIPGAHVLIENAKGLVPNSTLLEAAQIAATLSSAKSGAKVQVDYALRKNVRKPNGAKPGMVVYQDHNSIMINPDKTLVSRLKAK